MRTRADIVTTLSLSTGDVLLDEAGFIVDPGLWSPEFAEHIAKNEGIILTPLHWDILQYMRLRHADYGVMVDVRHVIKYLAAQEGMDKNPARRLLFELFPYGYVKQACKMAGMKQPRAWSTG